MKRGRASQGQVLRLVRKFSGRTSATLALLGDCDQVALDETLRVLEDLALVRWEVSPSGFNLEAVRLWYSS